MSLDVLIRASPPSVRHPRITAQKACLLAVNLRTVTLNVYRCVYVIVPPIDELYNARCLAVGVH